MVKLHAVLAQAPALTNVDYQSVIHMYDKNSAEAGLMILPLPAPSKIQIAARSYETSNHSPGISRPLAAKQNHEGKRHRRMSRFLGHAGHR
jgi:hypothetical protein